MPEALISSTTSPGPGAGSGKSISSSLRSPRNTTPLMPTPSLALPGQGRPAAQPPASTWCTEDTTTEPSPTDDATRFTDPARTSPTAKMPGRLVSKMCGARPPQRGWAPSSPPPPTADEAVVVQRHAAALQPLGVRHRAQHEEQVGDGARLLLPGAPVAPGHPLQVPLPV